MTECKSSFPFLENGKEAAELRSPENSVSPLLLTCTYTTQHNTTTQNQSINFQIKAEVYCNETEIDSENRSTWREELATDRAAEAIAAEENSAVCSSNGREERRGSEEERKKEW